MKIESEITPGAGNPSVEGPVLSLRGVVKRFGNVSAVDGISFDVARSEFFSLLGPSGCGKTTTLRMLAGFEQPSEGKIILEGRDASRVPSHKRNTNLVFQNYALFPHLSVFDNVAFGPQRKRLSKKQVRARVAEVLEAVRLGDLAKRYPRELSGGQQQRVALARALANQPAVLLLDEPLGALDLKLRENMQFELKRIQREVGISFVYVTHDQGEAMTMSDRIAVMNHGRIEHLGSPEEVYLRPASLFVAGFIGQASLLPCRLENVEGDGVTARLPDGAHIRIPKAAPGCRPGGDGMLVLRPEHLRLSVEQPIDVAARMRVTVAEEVFQGAVVRYLVIGEGELRMSVITPLDSRLEPGSVGRSVWLTWVPEWAYVVNADSRQEQDLQQTEE